MRTRFIYFSISSPTAVLVLASLRHPEIDRFRSVLKEKARSLQAGFS